MKERNAKNAKKDIINKIKEDVVYVLQLLRIAKNAQTMLNAQNVMMDTSFRKI